MGNFDEAVRAMQPPTNPVECARCGALVPIQGDDDHEVTVDQHGPYQTVSVICWKVLPAA